MIIDNSLLNQALGITPEQEIRCERLGLVSNDRFDTLTFLDDERFLKKLQDNPHISAVFITNQLRDKLNAPHLKMILCDDPRYYFFQLMNYVATYFYQRVASIIHPTAKIHPSASISDHNVQIDEGVVIGANAVLLPDVIIGRHCEVRPGAVLGADGFEHKRTSRGIVSVVHDGKVILESNVGVGANCCIDKGFSFRDTIVGEFTKLDNLVHVAHGVQIGKRCFLTAGVILSGSVTINDDVWIGPNATVSNQILIRKSGNVTIGAVVVKDVGENEKVSGNFALDHRKFLRNQAKLDGEIIKAT